MLALTGTPRNAAQIAEVMLRRAVSALIEGMDSLKAFDTAALWAKCVEPASRADVHALDLRHARHDRAAPPAHEMAELVDRGADAHHHDEQLGRLSAANLKRAHAQLESGTTIGKVVLEVT